jgi:hypothetical protein
MLIYQTNVSRIIKQYHMMCKVLVVGAIVPLVLFNSTAASVDNVWLTNPHLFIHMRKERQ